jgi:hypothetical protein
MQTFGNRDADLALPRQTAREGRIFALTLAGGFLFFALLGFWRGKDSVTAVAGALAGISFLAGILIPGRLEPVRRAWMKLGEAIGYITTPVLMAIVYYLVLTPIGLARRMFSARPKRSNSHWHQRPPLPPPARMERQF